MHGRPLIVVSLLLLSTLAGCIGGDDGGSGLDAAENESANNTSFELPEGREDVGAAYQETNQTEDGVGGMSHDHDYWQGKTRVTIFETKLAMEPYECEDAGGPCVEFRIPPPGQVYEGTGEVEITISNPERHACEGEFTFNGYFVCTDTLDDIQPFGIPAPEIPRTPDQGMAGALRLEYQHAATSDWQDGGELQWDTPGTIQITDPAQTDMPHSTASVWKFRLTSSEDYDTTLVFDVKGDILKSDEVALWPGHPDFYAEQSWRKIASMPGRTSSQGLDDGMVTGAAGGTEVVQPEKLISWGTRTLYAWVNISDVNGALTPTHWYLRWHNATGDWVYTSPFSDDYAAGETNYLYVLPVDDNAMDSPYSGKSRWEFMFTGAYTSPILTCLGGCMQYTVEYNLDLLATNQVLPDEEYTVTPSWAEEEA